MEVLCNAKLNLSLDITGVREDGYHYMDMVMQSVDFFDSLTFSKNNSNTITLSSNVKYLPTDERNLVYRAAALLADRFGVRNRGISVLIRKHIPSQAGLGGGSADAAGTLLALRTLWNLSIDDQDLAELGLSLGADIPFCLRGGTARVRGIGESIEPLPAFKGCWFVIAMPKKGASTKSTFQLIDKRNGYARPDTDALVLALESGDLKAVAPLLSNVFETADTSSSAGALIKKLISSGALGASLTGTGAAVFGLFETRKAAETCQAIMRKECRAWIAKPVNCGVFIKPGARSY